MEQSTETRRFNQTHRLGNIVGNTKLDFSGIPNDANEVDLRFITMIRQGDTFDGSPNPTSGLEAMTIMYGDRTAFQLLVDYEDGTCIHRRHYGHDLYVELYPVSRAFLEIQKIAHYKYFAGANLPLPIGAEEDWDQVNIGKGSLTPLENHPQYLDIVESMGIKLERVENSTFKVVVTKFHPKD
jgi:hypothetical protein